MIKYNKYCMKLVIFYLLDIYKTLSNNRIIQSQDKRNVKVFIYLFIFEIARPQLVIANLIFYFKLII